MPPTSEERAEKLEGPGKYLREITAGRGEGSVIKVGAHGLRGTLAGFSGSEVQRSVRGGEIKHLMKRQNILYNEKGSH